MQFIPLRRSQSFIQLQNQSPLVIPLDSFNVDTALQETSKYNNLQHCQNTRILETYHCLRYFFSKDNSELTLASFLSQISHAATRKYAIAILCKEKNQKGKINHNSHTSKNNIKNYIN